MSFWNLKKVEVTPALNEVPQVAKFKEEVALKPKLEVVPTAAPALELVNRNATETEQLLAAAVAELDFQRSWLHFVIQEESKHPIKRSQDLAKRCEERLDEVNKTLSFLRK